MRRFITDKSEVVTAAAGARTLRTFNFTTPNQGYVWFVENAIAGRGEYANNPAPPAGTSGNTAYLAIRPFTGSPNTSVISVVEDFRDRGVFPIFQPLYADRGSELVMSIFLRNDTAAPFDLTFIARLQIVELSEHELSSGLPYFYNKQR